VDKLSVSCLPDCLYAKTHNFEGSPPPTSSTWSSLWTFYSPNVYLALKGIKVRLGGLPPITYKDYILTLNPSDLSTIVHTAIKTNSFGDLEDGSDSPRRFNFADIQGPVPAGAYFAEVKNIAGPGLDGYASLPIFNGKPHKTIVAGNYWPRMSIPSAISNIAPEVFQWCKPDLSTTQTKTYYKNGTTTTWTTTYRFGWWDPPVKLHPVKGTLSEATFPTPPITEEKPSVTSFAVVAEIPPSLSTPLSTPVAPHNSKVPDVPILGEGTNGAASSLKQQLVATTMISRTTSSALPDSIIALIGTRIIQIGGPALILGDTVVSRTSNGDYIIESSQVSYLYPKTVQEAGQTGYIDMPNGGPKVQMSKAERTIEIPLHLRWVCALSF
jgi:hypothetical protein